MRIERKKVSDLRPAPYNPRRISDAALAGLAGSIEEFGLVEPIVWNKRTDRVVAGHQRLKVLEADGTEETDVVVVELDEEREKALNLALNNPHIAGQWTPDLEPLLNELDESMPDLMRALHLDDLRRDLWRIGRPLKEGETDPNEIPEAPDQPVTKPGSLWCLGEHRLLCGDATNAEDVARLMGESSAEVCLTDPPYCIGYEDLRRRPEIQTRRERGDVYRDPTDAAALLSFIDLVPSDILVMTFPINKHFHELATATQAWNLLYDCVWVKHSFAFIIGRRYQPQHEPILIFRRKKYRSSGTWRVPPNASTVFAFDRPTGNPDHPTVKPIELWQLLVQYHSGLGGIVYDPFLGSGTTIIAAEQLDRRCYAMEIEPVYCDVAVRRWENFTGRSARLEESKP